MNQTQLESESEIEIMAEKVNRKTFVLAEDEDEMEETTDGSSKFQSLSPGLGFRFQDVTSGMSCRMEFSFQSEFSAIRVARFLNHCCSLMLVQILLMKLDPLR